MTAGRPPYLADLDHDALAVLGREWLLHGHLQDRVGMALVMETADREEMQQVAIEEWMAASPIYSRRMQRAMRFGGSVSNPGGVDTICKNLQLDIGAPHEFMDFRFRVKDDRHAEFWLAHCGALMDVEPMGVEFVHGMCHTIEDPTFDATAAATNPQAAIRPIHRPPRMPADRMPHCQWRIDIDADAPAVEAHPLSARVAESLAATVDVEPLGGSEADGLPDYSGAFNPDLRLEDLSTSALRVVLQEFALQSHLLLRGLLTSVEGRLGAERVGEIVPRLVAGWCSLTAQRLRDALGLESTAEGLAAMLSLHPMFAPRSYVGVTITTDDDGVRVAFADCPVLREGDAFTWATALGGSIDAALDAIVSAFDPQARCEAVPTADGEAHAYRASIDGARPEQREAQELAIAKISSGAAFRFRTPRARLMTPNI
ncbi:MAG TPA: hypothetical protein VHD81_04580 [Mycobacteriales bacterium]|nr:hypothetical protein [Mycobacteriales bacterium]